MFQCKYIKLVVYISRPQQKLRCVNTLPFEAREVVDIRLVSDATSPSTFSWSLESISILSRSTAPAARSAFITVLPLSMEIVVVVVPPTMTVLLTTMVVITTSFCVVLPVVAAACTGVRLSKF